MSQQVEDELERKDDGKQLVNAMEDGCQQRLIMLRP